MVGNLRWARPCSRGKLRRHALAPGSARANANMAAISLAEALARVLATPGGVMADESVPLSAAHGRHLAAAVIADEPWPTSDRSAMDGFALAAGAGLPSGSELQVVGESLAGHPFAGALPPGTAVRIMTGALVPAGADTVVPVEVTSGFASVRVTFTAAVQPGQNIRRRGSEVQPGQVLLPPGTRIRAAEIGALAVLGRTQVAVRQRPVVAILATGDEIVPVAQQPAAHQVRESNSWALAAQVTESGGVPLRLGPAADAAPPLRAELQNGLQADVLLTIGGVSQGTHDLVHGLLAELGVATIFHGIELKPGKPTLFGVARGHGRTTFVFGLPGNPASCFTVFDLLVRPLLQRLLGQQPLPPGCGHLGGARWRANARLQAVPVRLRAGADGRLQAELRPGSPSGDPFALLGADGYALLPANAQPDQLHTAGVVPYAAGTQLS